MNARHALLAVAIALVWGVNFVAMKAGLATLPPFLFAFLRFAFAAFPLVFFYRPPAIPWKWLWAYALAQFTAQFALLFWGLKLGMTAGLSSAVIQAQAFFTIGLAALWLREVPTRMQWIAAALAFAGMAVIAWHVEGGTTLTGFALVVAAGLAWAVGNILTRHIGLIAARASEPVDAMQIVTWSSLLALLPLASLSLIFEGPATIRHALADIDWRTTVAVLFNAYAVTTFGFGAWSWLMRRHAATTVAPYALLVPIAGLASSALMLGEPLHRWTIAAAMLIVAGLALNQFGSSRPAGVNALRSPWRRPRRS